MSSHSAVTNYRALDFDLEYTFRRAIFMTLVVLIGCGPLNAETISAKYAGSIDLDSYFCQSTASSFVHRVCYNSQSMKLVLLLGTTYYLYCSVPSPQAGGLLAASSKGRYFNSNIKGRYSC
jgi:hypothetical protein